MKHNESNYIFAYLFSTINQKKGKGLELQRKACQLEVIRLAQNLSVEITYMLIFSDIISGITKISQREGLCDALKSLKENDFFVVYDLDRLARNSIALYKIKNIISQSKSKLVVVQENEKADEQEISLAIASHRKVITSQNSSIKKVKEKQKRKERFGNIPFGYCLAKNNIHIKKDKTEQKIIRKIEKARLKSKSFRIIVEALNTKGFRNRRNKPLTINQVYKINKVKITKSILRNPPYGIKIVNKEYEINFYEKEMIAIINELFKKGISYRKITAKLNSLGYRNRKNNEMQLTQVTRIIKRLNF